MQKSFKTIDLANLSLFLTFDSKELHTSSADVENLIEEEKMEEDIE